MIKTSSVSYDHVLLKPSEQIGLHYWNSWEMSYIVSGKGRRILGDTEEPFCAGEVVLVVPEMPHQWIFSPGETDGDGNIENITISFPADLLSRLSHVMPEFCKMAEWYEHFVPPSSSNRLNVRESHSCCAGWKRSRQRNASPRCSSCSSPLGGIETLL